MDSRTGLNISLTCTLPVLCLLYTVWADALRQTDLLYRKSNKYLPVRSINPENGAPQLLCSSKIDRYSHRDGGKQMSSEVSLTSSSRHSVAFFLRSCDRAS